MTPSPHDVHIPLMVESQPRRQAPVLPRWPWLFAGWMAVGAIVSVLAGLLLGILAALQTGIGGSPWTQAVEAHGRLQLFAFVGVFVTALGLEFLVRLYQRAAFPAGVRALVPGAIGFGAVLQSAGQLWSGSFGWLMYPGTMVTLAGSCAFAVLVFQTAKARSLVRDPQPLFFRAAGVWLVAAAVVSLWTVTQAESGAVLPVDSHAVDEVFLRGFILNLIIAVGLRAFAGHLDLVPPSPRKQFAVLALANAGVVAWLAGQGLGVFPELDALSRLGDIGLGLGFVLFTAWFGILRPLRRGFHEPRYQWLIPLAWLGGVLYAVALVAVAILPGGYDMSLYQQGAVRHLFMLGFVVPLMLAMGHVVLARFATGTVPHENLLTAACVAVIAATPLRVIPALIGDAPGDAGQGLLALAGLIAMAGLLLAAFVAATTALAMRRRMAAMAGSR